MQHHFLNLIFSSSTVEVMKEAQLSLHQLNFVARYKFDDKIMNNWIQLLEGPISRLSNSGLLWCVWVQNLIESSNMAASCSQLYKILHCKRIKKTRPVSSDKYIHLFQCRLCIKYTYIYVQNCLLLSLSTGHVRRMTFFLWGQWAD